MWVDFLDYSLEFLTQTSFLLHQFVNLNMISTYLDPVLTIHHHMSPLGIVLPIPAIDSQVLHWNQLF